MSSEVSPRISASIKLMLSKYSAEDMEKMFEEIRRTRLNPAEIARAIRREENLKYASRCGRPSKLKQWLENDLPNNKILEKAEREGASKTTLWRLAKAIALRRRTFSFEEWMKPKKKAKRLATALKAAMIARDTAARLQPKRKLDAEKTLSRRSLGELEALTQLANSRFKLLFEETEPQTYRLRI